MQAAEKNCDIYGPHAVSITLAQSSFIHFQSESFDVKEAPRSGRPVANIIDAIFENVDQDRDVSSYEVAQELVIKHKIILEHLKKAGYTKKLDI